MSRVHQRSGYRCEALVEVNGVFTRCWGKPVETHHMLTRARGGAILDRAGEIYHLIDCCRVCHDTTHGSTNDLEIDGYVTTHQDGRPLYIGTDEYLTQKYGPRHLPGDPSG